MKNTYAECDRIEFETCQQSFFDIVENICDNRKTVKHPLHRLFTLMRRMGALSFIKEELSLNEELNKEQLEAQKRCACNVEFFATRYTFFHSDPISNVLRNLF